MKKKLISLVLCMALIATMVAACGSKETGTTATEAPATEAPAAEAPAEEPAAEAPAEGGKTIVYWSMWEATEPQGQAIQAAVDAYQTATGNKVDLQFKGRTGIREGLQPALDAGTAIDMFDEDVDRVNGVWGKYLMDLEALSTEFEYETTARANLMQACRDAAGGTLKSIPYQPNVFAFFFNQDLFDQAGVTAVPTTWEEFLAVCEQLKAANIVPITCDDAYITCLFGYHLGRLLGEEGVKDVVTNGNWEEEPKVLELAKDYEDLAAKGYFSPLIGSNVWPAGQNSELALGQAAMYLNGSWLPNEVKGMTGDDFKWGCFSYPAVRDGKTGVEAANFGSQVLAINKDSQVSKEAFELIKYITTGQFDAQMTADSVGIPADTTNAEWPAMMAAVQPVFEGVTTRYTWAVSAEANPDMTPILKENFTKLCAGKMKAQEFVDAMEAASK